MKRDMWLEHDGPEPDPPSGCYICRPEDPDASDEGCQNCDDEAMRQQAALAWAFEHNAATPMLRLDGLQPPQPDGGVIVWAIAALIVAAVVAVFVVRF